MMKRLPLWFLIFSLLGGSLAQATLVPRLTVEQMIDESEQIVQGTVLRTWAAWDGARQFIWTHYELRVSDTLKGLPSVKIVVSEPGGMIGETGMQIAGAPRYRVGEEVVLFLTRTPIGYLRSCGWGQGKFDVRENADAGGKVVRSAVAGVTLVAPPGGQASPLKKPQTALGSFNGLALGEFKTRLRSLIRARAAEGGR